jgi:hypothetical protein
MSESTPKGELAGDGEEPWASEEDWVGVGVRGPEGQLDWFKYTGAKEPAVGDVIHVVALFERDIPRMPRGMDVQVTRLEPRLFARRLDDPPPGLEELRGLAAHHRL